MRISALFLLGTAMSTIVAFGADRPELITDLQNLESSLRASNRLPEAARLLRRALDIESRALSEMEKTGRIPVLGNEKRLRQAEEGSGEARTPYHFAVRCVPQVEPDPEQNKSARPDQPDVVIFHIRILWRLWQRRRPGAQNDRPVEDTPNMIARL